MILCYLLLLLALLPGIRFFLHGSNVAYLDREQTSAIKGGFIFVVFLSHIAGYIKRCDASFGYGGALYGSINEWFGQLMVAMFLFYSGYGVMCSIQKKGKEYIESMPRKRILTTLINFDIAVMVFLVIGLLLGNTFSVNKIAMSLLAWDDLGNSNWYIFVILLCYLVTWCVSMACVHLGWSKGKLCAGVCVGCVFVGLVLSFFKGTWWYDTIWVYPAGAVFAAYKQKIDETIKKKYWVWLIGVVAAFLVAYYAPVHWRGVRANIAAVAFALLVVLVTMKIRISNPVLVWSGVHLFPLYIYQRIPMIMLSQFHNGAIVRECLWAYVLSCAVVTVTIAYLYKYFEVRVR